jgi:oligoendopeptidase F
MKAEIPAILNRAYIAAADLRFLSSGSSQYSLSLLRDAGVDLLHSEPMQQAANLFKSYIARFEDLQGLPSNH